MTLMQLGYSLRWAPLVRGLAIIALASLLAPGAATAQRRGRARREGLPDLVSLTVTQREADPLRVVITLEAREAVEISADRRWLRAELRDGRGRRVVCSAPVRPRAGSRPRSLEAGQRWAEWLDVRELCWGRSLEALSATTEVRWTFDAGRGRAPWVARTAARRVAALTPHTAPWRPWAAPLAGSAPGAAAAPLRVELAPTDVRLQQRPIFRVRAVGGQATRRVFVRHESFSFRVSAPSGRTFECRVPPFAGRVLPDFFTRLSRGRVIPLALDGATYCGRFEEPGIYDVTPILTLSETGASWRLDALTGTFVGAPSALRVRAATYVEQPVE